MEQRSGEAMTRMGIVTLFLGLSASCTCGGGTCGADFQCFYPLDGGCLITPAKCCGYGDVPNCYQRQDVLPLKVDLSFDGGSCLQGAAVGGCG